MSITKRLTALVDGDVLLFRAGMAGQYKKYSAYLHDAPDAAIITMRYKKDLLEYLNNEGWDLEEVDIVTETVLEELPTILHTVNCMVDKLFNRFDDVEIYLSGGGNFREAIATEAPYKGNRWSKLRRDKERSKGNWIEWLDATEGKYKDPERPHWEMQIKQHLINKYEAIVVTGQEADDELGIQQSSREDTCIVSVDKDLKMIAGWHLNLADLDSDPIFVREEQANRQFYEQLLMGDATDNIPGLPRVGVKKAEAILEGCDEDEDMLMSVWLEYMDRMCDCTPEAIYTRMIERGRLLWIRRTQDEMWTPPILLDTLLDMTPVRS